MESFKSIRYLYIYVASNDVDVSIRYTRITSKFKIDTKNVRYHYITYIQYVIITNS